MAANSREAVSKTNPALIFPVRAITDNKRIEEILAIVLWALIPVEYYLFSFFSGGLALTEITAAACVTFLGFLLSLLFAFILAVCSRMKVEWEPRTRGWATAFVVTWAASAVCLLVSYLFRDANNLDVVASFLCAPKGFLRCEAYPSLGPITFAIYFVYGIIGAVTVTVLLNLLSGRVTMASKRSKTIYQPNLFAVIFFSALILTIVHGLTTIS